MYDKNGFVQNSMWERMYLFTEQLKMLFQIVINGHMHAVFVSLLCKTGINFQYAYAIIKFCIKLMSNAQINNKSNLQAGFFSFFFLKQLSMDYELHWHMSFSFISTLISLRSNQPTVKPVDTQFPLALCKPDITVINKHNGETK